MSTTFKPRPRVRVSTHPIVRTNLTSRKLHQGYNQSRDVTLRFEGEVFPNFSISDAQVQIAWKHDAQKRVAEADIDIQLSGFGWAKLEKRGSTFDSMIDIRDGHVILFEKRHIIVVPAVPLTDLVEKLHMESRWPCVIKGYLDTRTDVCRVELEWL